MIYILTVALFLLGVGYFVTKKIDELKVKYPTCDADDVLRTFLKEDWNTLIRSFLVLCTYEIFIFITQIKAVVMPVWWEKYLVVYALSLVLGYAGQRLIYKYLGTAESELEKRADTLKDKL